MVTIPLFPQLVFLPHPELAIPDLLHFLLGPYPPPPLLFLGGYYFSTQALTFDFPSFHGRGTRDEGDRGYSRRDALPPPIPSLSCLFSFLLSPDFH